MSERTSPSPANSALVELEKYGRNRLSEGKLPACAEMCSTKALLAGDGDVLSDIYRERVTRRGRGGDLWGHATAYGRSDSKPTAPVAPAAQPAAQKS